MCCSGCLGIQEAKVLKFTILFFFISVLVALVFSTMIVTAVSVVATPTGPSGTIHVDGSPVGMAISVDDIPYGTLPDSGILEIVQIPIGSHTLGAAMEGYQPKDTLISVLDGQITKVRVELREIKTGILEIQSNPTNVQVFLDDMYKGITPMTLTTVPTGNHTVLLKLNGFQDWTSPVTINPDGQQLVSGTLTRLTSASLAQQPAALATQAGGLPGMVVLGLFVTLLVFRYKRE